MLTVSLRYLSPTILVALLAGCGAAPDSSASPNPSQVANSPADKGHDHSGWWCTEHGVPEDQCGLCNSKLATDFKRKGDWCKEHDRPDSQCFICHPEYEGKFIALYEAKFGTKPPPRSAEAKEASE